MRRRRLGSGRGCGRNTCYPRALRAARLWQGLRKRRHAVAVIAVTSARHRRSPNTPYLDRRHWLRDWLRRAGRLSVASVRNLVRYRLCQLVHMQHPAMGRAALRRALRGCIAGGNELPHTGRHHPEPAGGAQKSAEHCVLHIAIVVGDNEGAIWISCSNHAGVPLSSGHATKPGFHAGASPQLLALLVGRRSLGALQRPRVGSCPSKLPVRPAALHADCNGRVFFCGLS